jgi:uncharacterized membrane protein YbhN (UPF0104 family)
MKVFSRWWSRAASLLVLGLAGYLLWRQSHNLDFDSVVAALAATPPPAIALSLLLTAISFACLAAFERMATRWIAPGKVPRTVAWKIGLETHALANTLGFHAVTAVALRIGNYRPYGIETATVAKIVATIAGCIVTGVVAILVVALAWSQLLAGHGALVLVPLVAFAAGFVALRQHLRRTRGEDSLVLSHVGMLLLVGLVEMSSAVAAFYVLLPAGALPSGPTFVFLYVSAMLLGLISHAPGGIGVFEATMLAAAADSRHAEVLAAMLAFRVLYNLLPCSLALLAIGIARVRGRKPGSTTDTRP